jgi:hypothetical protein
MRLLRPILFSFLAPLILRAAPALEITQIVVSDSEGGIPLPPDYAFSPGDRLFFTCHIAGFRKSQDDLIHLKYSIEAFDPGGTPLVPLVNNSIDVEVSPQDARNNWTPKIHTEVALPPLLDSGVYRIVVKASDVLAEASAEKTISFQIRGREAAPSETLTVQNFQFVRGENDDRPLAHPLYRPGDTVWARFDLAGYRYGPGNRMDVSYAATAVSATGKVLWKQPEPAEEKSESFYPKRYLPAEVGITLGQDVAPGEYSIGVEVQDAIGHQSYQSSQSFTVE